MDRMIETVTEGGVILPGTRKAEGGTYFDDELETKESHDSRFKQEMQRLVQHINERPDYTVYVGSSDERHQMRLVFNAWFNAGLIRNHPTINIDYGVANGAIRVGDGR